MKILKTVLMVLLTLVIFSCNDGDGDGILDPPTPQKVKITTLEKGTRIPIPHATVFLYKCSNSDIEFGCTKYQLVSSLTTNSQGEVEYIPNNNVVAMEGSHPDYWDHFQKNYYGEILLSPNAWIKLNLVKIGDYSSDCYVSLKVVRTCDNCGILPFKFNFSQSIGLPSDTTFVIKVEGTEKTTILWDIFSDSEGFIKSDASEQFTVGKFDTLQMKLQY